MSPQNSHLSASLLAVGLALSILAGMAGADPFTIVEPKWSQLPDLTARGFDYSSQRFLPAYQDDLAAQSVVAEDFQCTALQPITYVHFWGSLWQVSGRGPSTFSNYWPDPSLAGGAADEAFMRTQLTGFQIRFYSDIAAGVDPVLPYSHPGSELTQYTQFMPIADVASNLYGIIHRIGPPEVIGDAGDEAVWQYNLALDEPFDQVPGTWYWLSIQAITVEECPLQWGWHQAVQLVHDNSVQNGTANQWGLMYDQLEWVLLPDVDMAFELSDVEVPEPATLALLGTGLGAMLAAARRKKA